MPNHRDAIIDLENLEQLSRTKLRALWTEELAEKPPASLGRDIAFASWALFALSTETGSHSWPVGLPSLRNRGHLEPLNLGPLGSAQQGVEP
jgi:hypothetical protein